jgi:hypothetical protein
VKSADSLHFFFIKEREIKKDKKEIRKRDKVKRRMEKETQREIEGYWSRKKNRKIAVSVYKHSIRDPQKVTSNPSKALK